MQEGAGTLCGLDHIGGVCAGQGPNVERIARVSRPISPADCTIGHNERVTTGKRAGARPKRQFRPDLLALAVGTTVCVIAWLFLVKGSIDFFTDAQDGNGSSWGFFALAAIGAAACLFAALMLLVRVSRALGLTPPPAPRDKP